MVVEEGLGVIGKWLYRIFGKSASVGVMKYITALIFLALLLLLWVTGKWILEELLV
jgi:hypothetical protein